MVNIGDRFSPHGVRNKSITYKVIDCEYNDYGMDEYYWMRNETSPDDVIYLSEDVLIKHYERV